MWCRECQQDVPGVDTAESGKYVCPRCEGALSAAGSSSDVSTPIFEPINSTEPIKGCACQAEGLQPCSENVCDKSDSEPSECPCHATRQATETLDTAIPQPPFVPNWELEEQLRHIERMFSEGKPGEKSPAPTDQRTWMRLDAAHGKASRHVPGSQKKGQHSVLVKNRRRSWFATFTWSMLLFGIATLVCGGLLLAGSIAMQRGDLWSLGMPVVLVGQLVMLMGFILQLDRLWHHNRSTSDTLESMGRRLDELNTNTSLLGTSPTSPSASFYSHMAGGANPQLLLADLKSQLDLLTLKLDQVDS